MNISRPYVSPRRDEAARETERRILDAAERLLVADGYAATTVAAIAEAAGVSKQTVYNSGGSKPELLKRLYDVRLAGDPDPVPLAERPEVQRIGALSDPRELLAGYGRIAGAILERLGPVLSVVLQGATGGDPELRALLDTTDAERLVGATIWTGRLAEMGALRSDLDAERARDIVWAVNSPQTWDLLVRRRGWSTAEYGHWLGASLSALLLPPPGSTE